MQDFEDLPWHDAELQRIVIDRSDPDHKDEIKLLVCWPDTEETNWIIFSKCYACDAKMNFGIVAYESILNASCLADTPRLKEIQEKWKSHDVDLSDLKCYRIECNSTGSEINIYARRFDIVRQ